MTRDNEIVSPIAADHRQNTLCESTVRDTIVEAEGCGCTAPGDLGILEASKSKFKL